MADHAMNEVLRYKLTITPLTGIHIGTGEQYDWWSYSIMRAGKEKPPLLVRYDAVTATQALSDAEREVLAKHIENGRDAEARKMLVGVVGGHRELRGYTSAVTDAVWNLWGRHKNDVNNQMLIDEAYRDSHGRLVLPGSSIKGAIRTALLDAVFARRIAESNDGPPDALRSEVRKEAAGSGRGLSRTEKTIFGYRDAKEDPMRAISIADGVVRGDASSVVADLKLIRRRGDPEGIQMIAEWIRGTLLGGNAVIETTMTVRNGLFRYPSIPDGRERWNRPKAPWDDGGSGRPEQLILNACDSLYGELAAYEHEAFHEHRDRATAAYGQRIVDWSTRTRPKEGGVGRSEAIIRIGRYSQKQGVTFDFEADVFDEVRQREREPKTRTLIHSDRGLVPAGWAILRIEPVEEPARAGASRETAKKRVVVRKGAKR